MPEPTDPSRSSNKFESQLNIIRARTGELRTHIGFLKETVAMIEDVLTSPTPSSLDKSTQFGTHIAEFALQFVKLMTLIKDLENYVSTTVASNPNETPERIKRIVDALAESITIKDEATALHTYVFSLRPPSSSTDPGTKES